MVQATWFMNHHTEGSKLEMTLKPSLIHDSIYMTPMKNNGRTGVAEEACDSEDYAETISGLLAGIYVLRSFLFTSAKSLSQATKSFRGRYTCALRLLGTFI